MCCLVLFTHTVYHHSRHSAARHERNFEARRRGWSNAFEAARSYLQAFRTRPSSVFHVASQAASTWSYPPLAPSHPAPQEGADEEQGREEGVMTDPDRLLGYISTLCRVTPSFQNQVHFPFYLLAWPTGRVNVFHKMPTKREVKFNLGAVDSFSYLGQIDGVCSGLKLIEKWGVVGFFTEIVFVCILISASLESYDMD